jgi:hypothetical protein
MANLISLVSGFILGSIFVPYWPLLIKLIKQTYHYARWDNWQAGERQDPNNVWPRPPDSAQNPPPDFRKL